MMRAFRNPLLVLAATVTLALVPASASAGSQDVLRDCADNGMLDGRYSKSTLNAALQSLGGDLAEYSDCHAVISAALAASPGPKANSSDNDGGPNGAGGTGADGGSGAGGQDGDREGSDGKQGADEGDGGMDKQLASIDDGFGLDDASGSDGDSGGISLPAVLALIVLALAAAAGGIALAARRNPALAERLRRVPLPGRRG